MALINCPECNQKISNKATFCPNCGLPRQPNFREWDIEKENEKPQHQNKFPDSSNRNKTEFNNIKNQKALTFRKNPGCISTFVITVIVTFIIVLSINYLLSDNFIDSIKGRKYSQLETKYTKVNLNVRNKPSTESKILRTLNINSDISTYDTLVNGFTILINRFDSTKLGWVSNKYLQDSPLSESQLEEIKEKKNEAVQKRANAWRNEDRSAGAWLYAKSIVKRSLKSPSTADFPNSIFYTDYVSRSGQVYTIRSYVDSQNGFGATIRSTFTVKIEQVSKDNWSLIDFNIY